MRNRQTNKKFKFHDIVVQSRWCTYTANQHDSERSLTYILSVEQRAYGSSSSVLLGAFFSEPNYLSSRSIDVLFLTVRQKRTCPHFAQTNISEPTLWQVVLRYSRLGRNISRLWEVVHWLPRCRFDVAGDDDELRGRPVGWRGWRHARHLHYRLTS